MKTKMVTRVWEDSPLIGEKVKDINQNFDVTITKVARGSEATNPSGELKIREADYISFVAENEPCLKLLKNTKSN